MSSLDVMNEMGKKSERLAFPHASAILIRA